jgi:hypothetical protein
MNGWVEGKDKEIRLDKQVSAGTNFFSRLT